MAETWVLKQHAHFSMRSAVTYQANFVSNGMNFSSIRVTYGSEEYEVYYDNTYICDGDGGSLYLSLDSPYRTLAFDPAPAGDLLTWLEANAVKQEEPEPTDETWLINEIIDLQSIFVSATINFTSNETTFSTFTYRQTLRYIIQYDSNTVWNDKNYWSNEAYRTVTFETAPTGDLLTWLEANAVKQTPPTPSSYSITYHANGGTPVPEDLTEQTNLPTPLPTVSKTGYTFDGWFYDATFTSPATAGDALTDNVNLYAKFTLVRTTYDLSTHDWSVGSHSLTFVSQADGYRDADPSSPALTFDVYAVSLTATNGTLSDAVTKIAPWETKTATLTAASGYKVPDSIDNPPDGVTYTKTSSTAATITIDGENVADTVTLSIECPSALPQLAPTQDTAFQSGSDSVIEWSEIENASRYDIMVYENGEWVPKGEVTPTPPTPAMPQKGDLIEMNLAGDPVSGVTLGTQYRVISIDGNIAEVLAMTNANDYMTFNDDFVNTYAGGTLDNYLITDVYNALNAAAKAALVPKTFKQDSWYWGTSGDPDYSGYYGSTKPGTTAYTVSLGSTTFGEEISRSIYALSMQDVIDYVKDTTLGDGELQNYNIWKMFWNDEVSHSEYPWLRSALAGAPFGAWGVRGIDGFLDILDVGNEFAVRPAFQIDLSKITWTPSN